MTQLKDNRVKEKKCEHEKVEIWTQYFRNAPAKIVRAYCPDCEVAMPKIKDIYQDRENKIYEAYGNKSPVVIWDDKVETIIQQKWEANP